jgi:hypothetical protein
MLFFAFCLLVYFLPLIIGHQKGSFGAIFVLNLLLGWTVIGWIAALIWASADEVRARIFAVQPRLLSLRRDLSGGRAILLVLRRTHLEKNATGAGHGICASGEGERHSGWQNQRVSGQWHAGSDRERVR